MWSLLLAKNICHKYLERNLRQIPGSKKEKLSKQNTCKSKETVRQHEDVGRQIVTSRGGWKWISNRYKAGGQVHVPTMFASRYSLLFLSLPCKRDSNK